MTFEISPSEFAAKQPGAKSWIEDDVVYGDPLFYWDGCTTALLRSGVDGPYAGLADRLCNINGRHFE